jgi:hypothetical protein
MRERSSRALAFMELLCASHQMDYWNSFVPVSVADPGCFIPDPGSGSEYLFIPDPGSRIPDPES